MVRKIVFPVSIIVLLLVSILYVSGAFTKGKIEPGKLETPSASAQGVVVKAELRNLAEKYSAVGTVQSQQRITISSLISGIVREVHVSKIGETVKKGDLLITLDAQEFDARHSQAEKMFDAADAAKKQAEQGLLAAQAGAKNAESEFRRSENLHKSKDITDQQFERVKTEWEQSKAALEQAKFGVDAADSHLKSAKSAVEEARIMQGYKKICASVDGVIADKQVEPGDLAWPGKQLLVLHDPKNLRIEANVREGLINRLKTGDKLEVFVNSLNLSLKDCAVTEIVPLADPTSHSFLVKAALPRHENLYPGMFARLLIPIDSRQTVFIPLKAVRQVGQLSIVNVQTAGQITPRYVRLGEVQNDQVEVLSGLDGQEEIVLP